MPYCGAFIAVLLGAGLLLAVPMIHVRRPRTEVARPSADLGRATGNRVGCHRTGASAVMREFEMSRHSAVGSLAAVLAIPDRRARILLPRPGQPRRADGDAPGGPPLRAPGLRAVLVRRPGHARRPGALGLVLLCQLSQALLQLRLTSIGLSE